MFTNLSLSTHKILTPSFQHKKTNNQHSFVGFFSGELTHLRIRLSLVARFGIAEETVVASRCVSALLSFAVARYRDIGKNRSCYATRKCAAKTCTAPNCLPLAELEGKMPLAADEV